MYFDTHAHYFDHKFDALDGGVDGILSDPAFCEVVSGVINVGTNMENSRVAVAQAGRYPFMVAAVGIHPEDCQSLRLDPDTELARLRAWISDPDARVRDRIVAIGEIGYDNHWEPVDHERQKAFFEGQMALAAALDLPVIIHDREAHGDSLDMIRRFPEVRGVFHAYSGSAEMARELVRRGWYIAFGGAVTFRNAERLRAVAASVPLDRFLLETDCPYMAPVPHRGAVNHSGYLPLIGETVAALHGISAGELAEKTAKSADALFGWSRFIR